MPIDPELEMQERERDPADAFSRAMDARPSSTRERDLRRYGPPRRHTQLIWIAIAVVGLALFAVLMRGVMEKTQWTAGGQDVDTAAPSQ